MARAVPEVVANYTSGVPVEKSLTEITRALVKFGARGISTEYDGVGRAVALSFALPSEDPNQVADVYHLPARIEGMQAALERAGAERRYRTLEHAERVTWRCLRDWVRAQLAIVDAGLTTLDEVMFPYMRTVHGTTVFEERQKQLEAPR
jgi:hypothetical protein